MALTKIGSIGINTGIQLAGVTTAASLKVGTGVTIVSDGDVWVGGAVTIGGNLEVTGDITYDEITGRNLNITGISTFNDDILFKGANAGITSAYWDKSANRLNINDDAKFSVGTGGDLEIYHDSSHSWIKNSTGYLRLAAGGSGVTISNADNSETMAAFLKDGAVELYHNNIRTLATESNGIRVYGPEGGSGILKIYADEGDDNQDLWQIVATTGGELHFQSYTSGSWEDCLHLIGNGGSELYYDNSKKLETKTDGVLLPSASLTLTGQNTTHTAGGLALGYEGSHVHQIRTYGGNDANAGQLNLVTSRSDGTSSKTITLINSDGNLNVPDSQQLQCGNGADLKLYHDGSYSYVKNSHSGGLWVSSDLVVINNAAVSENMAKFIADGAVELYHNHVKKFETYADGAKIFGQEGTSAALQLLADDGDDNGDTWEIRSNQDANDLTFKNNTSRSLVDILTLENDGDLTLTGQLRLVDNKKAMFGTNEDLEIHHDGSNSRIHDTGTGVLALSGSDVHVQNNNNSQSIAKFLGGTTNSSAEFYYNDSKKIETISTGVNVTGGIRLGGNNAANECDDYEEGTWTPSVTTASGTITVGASFHAEYTKIGRMVYITARFTISAVSSPSGWLRIYTLPFTADSFAGLAITTTGLGDTDDKIPQGLVEYNTTFGMLRTFRDGIESDNISGYFQNGTAIIMSACYNIA